MMYIEQVAKRAQPPNSLSLSLSLCPRAGREVSHLKATRDGSQGHLITIYFP